MKMMKMKKMIVMLPLLLALALLFFGATRAFAQAQVRVQTPSARLEEEQGPLSLSATGRVSWLVKYGIGDARGLTERGYANQILLEQALSVDTEGGVRIDWPLSGILSLSAHLDNQKAENLQLLSIKYQGRNLEGEFGDFTVAGNTGFTGYDKSLKGLSLEWTPRADLEVRSVFARVEGLPQSKVFHGNTSPATLTFMLYEPEQRWLERPYPLNIRGLEYYKISGFVPGFTELDLLFRPDQGLRDLLGAYGLSYLFPMIKEAPQKEVDPADYVVVDKGGEQFLILMREALELLREALKGYIDDYNEAQGLSGEERKEYPLDEGSEYELGFLKGLLANYVVLARDGIALRLDAFARERFYYLGYREIDPDSVEVKVKLGEADFIPITDPSLFDYDYYLFPEEGLIELAFPAAFFAALEENQVEVSFNYAVSGGLYLLGLSIAWGSERVYLNGELLQRDVDYTIDYETGALLLFQELGPEDELRIDYEIYRGGLGGATEYKRDLAGLLLSYNPAPFLTVSLDLLRAADSPAGVSDWSTLRSMPNDHIVGGLSAKLELGGFSGALELGYNYNRFPFDDNERKNRPNRINAIRAISYQGREYLLFGDQNGLIVFSASRDLEGEKWRALGPAEGLAGRSVRDIAVGEGVIVFATDSGISLLQLKGEDPFAILTNWRRFYSQDGLVSQDVYAALIQDGILYLGTAEGLNRVPLERIGEKESWEVYQRQTHQEMVSDQILKLVGDGKFVYLGTPTGLMILDPTTGTFSVPPELAAARINDLAASAGAGTGPGREVEVLVATELGIRAYERGKGMGWLSLEPARAVAAFAGQVWYGTDEGLYRLSLGSGPGSSSSSESEPIIRGKVTALALGGDKATLWVGTEATAANYELTLWEVVDAAGAVRVRSYPQQRTRIDGKDKGHFEDIPAAEHTDLGPALSLSLSQELGNLKLKGALQALSPKFTALESEERQDIRGWSLEGTYNFSEALSLTLKHEANLEGAELALMTLARQPSYSEKDSVGLEWDFGPKLDLSYALERIDDRGGEKDGFDELRHELSGALSSSFFAERLDLSLDYGLSSSLNLRLAGRASLDQQLKGKAALHLLPGLDLIGQYGRAGRTTRWGGRERSWGSEELDLSLNWAFSLPFGSADAKYNWKGSRSLPLEEGEAEAEQDGQLALEPAALKLGELTLYPRGTVSFQQGAGRLSLTGEGSLRGELGAFKAQANYKLTAGLDRWSHREDYTNNLAFHLDFSGWKELTPSLDLSGTLRVLSHPSYGTKRLENWTATAGLGWKGSTTSFALTNSLALSLGRVKEEREDTFSCSLKEAASLGLSALPPLAISLEANARYLRGERSKKPLDGLEGELVLKGNYKLRGGWEASGLVGYVLNIDRLDEEGSYQSLYLSAQLATTF
ncbi:MAG: hypothetical protein ACUVUT_01140 [Candidatus Bipolaricaulia bacterium]